MITEPDKKLSDIFVKCPFLHSIQQPPASQKASYIVLIELINFVFSFETKSYKSMLIYVKT